MKLAEAIQEKTNLKKTISDLRERLEKAAGAAEKTNENPVRLLGDLEESLKRMERLGAAIYHTNDLIKVDGKTMTQMIHRRDTLLFRQELYKKLIRLMEKNAKDSVPADLSINELQNQASRVRLEMRTLNDQIQKVNRTRELVE